MTKMTKAQKVEQEDAINALQDILPVGSKVTCLVTHVARSGMSRRMRFWDSTQREITSLVAKAIDYRLHTDGALKVGGCGMDMGFAVVHSLSYALHGTGYTGDPKVKAGYTLTHRWL